MLPGRQEEATTFLDARNRLAPFRRRSAGKPHILFITVDMISPDCYLSNHPLSHHIKLPNIRSIAEAGTRFDNAVCTSPLCGPSRASIFTGRYPPYLTNNERAPVGMKTELQAEDRIFQEYLLKSGYTTKHVGKCHVGTAKFMSAFGENDAAWDRWSPPLTDDDEYVAFLRRLNVEPPVYKKELIGRQFDRTSPGNSFGGWIMQKNGKPFPLEAHYSMYLADKAIGKLEAAHIQKPGKPVYVELDFFDPHQPFSVPAGFEERADELRKHVTLPSSYTALQTNDFKPAAGESDIYSLYRRYWGAYDPELVRDYITAHLLQMEVVDHAVGKVLEAVRKLGLWNNTLIIFTADHGDMNGHQGLFDKGVYFQPEIFRVPLSIKLPADMGQTRKVVDRPASTLDISQTILDCARIAIDAPVDGESLVPLLQGLCERTSLQQLFQTGWHVGVNYGAGINHYQDADHHWFYGYNISTGQDELYNMSVNDGLNLIHDPAAAGIRLTMIAKLAQTLQSDPRWLGYWATFRLHMAEFLPKNGDDMQMFKPKE